jgi:hypothetical protein
VTPANFTKITHMEKAADTLRAWCDKVAALGVDMLVEQGLVLPANFDAATKLVAEEIRIRIFMGDKPPNFSK